MGTRVRNKWTPMRCVKEANRVSRKTQRDAWRCRGNSVNVAFFHHNRYEWDKRWQEAAPGLFSRVTQRVAVCLFVCLFGDRNESLFYELWLECVERMSRCLFIPSHTRWACFWGVLRAFPLRFLSLSFCWRWLCSWKALHSDKKQDYNKALIGISAKD